MYTENLFAWETALSTHSKLASCWKHLRRSGKLGRTIALREIVLTLPSISQALSGPHCRFQNGRMAWPKTLLAGIWCLRSLPHDGYPALQAAVATARALVVWEAAAIARALVVWEVLGGGLRTMRNSRRQARCLVKHKAVAFLASCETGW